MRTASWATILLALLASSAHADDLGAARGEFRSALKSDSYKDRQDAYVVIASYDGADAAREVLRALAKEKNPAVIYTGLRTLAGMKSDGAREVYRETLTGGKGKSRMFVLMALDATSGPGLDEAIHSLLTGKDGPAAAQAALALGRRRTLASLPRVLPLLRHKHWQVRRAAAMAVLSMASPPPLPVKPGSTEKPVTPPTPEEVKTPEVISALVAGLANSEGSDRAPMLRALTKITGQDYGLDIPAWKQLAAGKDPTEIVRKPVPMPHAFGIPILGRRIVVCFDRSLRMDDGHPFGRGDRIEKLCDVPGARPIAWMRLYRVRQFAAAHIRRMFDDMPKRARMEVILFHTTLDRMFGKFVSPGAATKKVLKETLDELEVGEGINTYDVLMLALDIAGEKDAKAWKSGPDEVIFITANQPTVGEIRDPDVVGSAIGLKARLRMVPVHTIGIKTHAYDMMRTIAAESSGTYRDYHK